MAGLRWGLRTGMSEFPGDTGAAGLGAALGKPLAP